MYRNSELLLWKSYQFAEKQREKIYVLDDGKSLMLALSQELSQNRPVEAKEHVKRFHELFYTLSPDKNAIESNIQRSCFLQIKVLLFITRTFQRMVTIIESYLGTSIKLYMWIV